MLRTPLNRSTHAAGACTLPFRAVRNGPILANYGPHHTE